MMRNVSKKLTGCRVANEPVGGWELRAEVNPGGLQALLAVVWGEQWFGPAVFAVEFGEQTEEREIFFQRVGFGSRLLF